MIQTSSQILSKLQWLSGRVLDSRPKGRAFEPHRRHCVVSLSKNINPSLVLVQPRKTSPFITERLLMGRKESNQTNKQTKLDLEKLICALSTRFVHITSRIHQNCGRIFPYFFGPNVRQMHFCIYVATPLPIHFQK